MSAQQSLLALDDVLSVPNTSGYLPHTTDQGGFSSAGAWDRAFDWRAGIGPYFGHLTRQDINGRVWISTFAATVDDFGNLREVPWQ